MLSTTERAFRLRHVSLMAALCLVLGALTVRAQDQGDKDAKDKRASLSLKANPTISFSPSRVVVTAELKGGSNQTDEYYCPSVEWEWGDETRSESSAGCEPFQAGTSDIQRRWTTSHVYNTAGNYRIVLRLKRNNKVVAAGNTSVQVKAGLRDQSDF